MSGSATTRVEGPGGRALQVHEAGDPAGRPVVVHHGTPGDGSFHEAWVEDALARGIRLVGFDRAGYGGSDPHPDRHIGDVAADVVAIADALGIDRFATWGISGGGAHALACAALLADRVVAAASLAGTAPFDAEGLNYFAGMGEDNLVEFGAAMVGREAIEPIARAGADAMLAAAPADIAAGMQSLVSDPDRAALEQGVAAYLSQTVQGGLATGIEGWLEDDFAFLWDFGFDVGAIAVPVLVWHGRHDRFVPVAHGEWLAAHIPGAEARISDEDGHLTLITRRVPDVHRWLLERF